jgi:hypothetical protein
MDKLQNYLKRIWTKMCEPNREQQEKGQSVVLLAIMVVVLLLFAGIALDSGLIYMRRIQLSRAVDAAALACVEELPNMSAVADRAGQFMTVNGLDPTSVLIASGGYFTVTHPTEDELPEGSELQNTVIVKASWRSKTVFMQLIGFDHIDLQAQAMAEYLAFIDMFSSQTGESGKLGPVNLSIFGPDQTPSYGDACSCPARHLSGKLSTYEPTEDNLTEWEKNPNKEVCWPRGYPFRIHVPAGVNQVRIEILDPETWNNNITGNVFITNVLPITNTTEGILWNAPNSSRDTAMYVDDDEQIDEKRYWSVRMDENRAYNSTPSSYCSECDTLTKFHLYYMDENNEQFNMVTYTGRKDNESNTDLTWVCPGGRAAQDPQYGDPKVDLIGYGTNYFLTPNPSFEIDMTKLTNITTAPDGSRSLYLDVESVDGWSENGFDLWAGPATEENINYWGGERAYVNARNLWIDRQRALSVTNPHDSGGVVTYGRGILPLNVNANTEYEVTLAYIPEAARGVDLCVYKWDTDVGSNREIAYWFDGYPGESEGMLSAGNSWTETSGNYNWDEGCDEVSVPNDFLGGYLHARYKVGQNDTSTWMMKYKQPVPGSSFVRLVQ